MTFDEWFTTQLAQAKSHDERDQFIYGMHCTRKAWNSRQAEIDKLKTEWNLKQAEIDNLKGKIQSLFNSIEHGDIDHREWLENAINNHFKINHGESKNEI